ncbi:zinc finger CCCH domain-containing protein 13 [Microdochium nivale]|nr:zinc finger CCCH domain-containing protein 13 [Microdochium nivale]
MIAQSIPEGHTSAAHVDHVDAFSRRLYRRARTAGPAFGDIASVVQSLHTVLKHLKSEIEDPASLLGSASSSVYARQLTPLVEDCDFALQQLEVVLDKHEIDSAAILADSPHGKLMPGEKGWVLGTGERDRLELIRAKLATQELNVDMFLNTVQLRNTRRHDTHGIDTSHVDMDLIKDKVDAIATRICHFKDSDSVGDDDELWQKFRDELVHEGFSEDVLRQNQDVLRAYIRQLDQQTMAHNGSMPSVRGFLEQYDPAAGHGRQLAPYEDYPAAAELSTHAMSHSPHSGYATSDDTRSLDRYKPSEFRGHKSHLSFDSYSSEDDDIESNSSLALMSTRDLMAIDRRSNDLAIAHANRGLPAPREPFVNGMEHPVESPPNCRYLPPSASLPALLPPPGPEAISGALVAPGCQSPPPVLLDNSISAPVLAGENPSLPTATRLAPDSRGQDIPLDAKWTRIKRSLVSIEVLDQRGFRFEARPTFVAILGALSREEVEELARRTVEIREMRRVAASKVGANEGVKVRRPEDRYHPDKYRNWDIETPKDPNNNGYVINPGGRRKNSHASEASELYDSSDEDSESDSEYTDDEDRFRPPRHKPQPYHHTHSELRARGDSVASHASSNSDHRNGDDDKGTKAYPFIVPAPVEENRKAPIGDRASPAATVLPKPILKNKGEPAHVRFNPEPQVLDESMSPPSRSLPRRGSRSHGSGRDRNSHSDRYVDRDAKDRDRDRDRDRDQNRDRDRDHGEKHDNRDRARSDRDRDDYYREDHDSRSHRSRRDRGDSVSSSYGHRKDSSSRRRGRNGALTAAGIGGAAASLLSVLTEAAAAL